jgi:hypothetical protein
MATKHVLYPGRHVLRSSQASSIVMLGEGVLMTALIAVGAARSERPLQQFIVVGAVALLSLGIGVRILSLLKRLEAERETPDEVMRFLFDLSVIVPVVGLLAVTAAMRWS